MRIRKRRVQEVDDSAVQRMRFSATTLQKRKDHNERLEIPSEALELATRSGGEAAALSLVLLAAEAVPHAAQDSCVQGQEYYRADAGVPSDDQFYKADSVSGNEKLDTPSNTKAASGQSTSQEGMKSQHSSKQSSSIHETGSYSTSSSEGNLPARKVGECKETSTHTVCEYEEGLTHPCNQLKGSLIHSLHSIFSELPRNVGLSAREALSKIQKEGLAGLIEGDGLPGVQVAKIMRSNPYFVRMRGGKYLFTKFPNSVDCEPYEVVPGSKHEIQESREAKEQTEVGSGRVSSFSTDEKRSKKEVTTRALGSSSQVENIGTRCTRVDGRSWQCRRTSLPGFSLCEHHHLQLNRQSRRQRNFQRAFNQSSRKRFRKGEKVSITEGEALEGNETSITKAGRRKVVKARSLEAIVRSTTDIGAVSSSLSIS